MKIPESKLKEIYPSLCTMRATPSVTTQYSRNLEKFWMLHQMTLREMHRSKEKTFCCGAGGSNYWYKVPQQKTISGIRTKEASETGANTLATECPFCLSMFEDSTKVSGTKMDVRDIAEIVAEQTTITMRQNAFFS